METILQVLKVLLILVEVVIVFNLMIVVHELGHFLAARWRGLVVEKFAIWFGKPIWKRTYNGVQYQLGSLPFGGFVALPQMAPMETIEGRAEGAPPARTLPPITPLDKIIVAFAGPLFSFGLACLFAVLIWVIGRPVLERETNLVIGYVAPDSPAQKAGLRPGDRILEVDGDRPTRFGGMSNSVVWSITRSEGDTIPFKVNRDGQELTFNPTPMRPEGGSWWRRSETRQVGIAPASTPMVGSVAPDSPAARAGLRANDLLRSVNGQPMLDNQNFFDLVQNNGRPLTLGVERDKQPLTLTMTGVPFAVGGVIPASPAAVAGIQPGDVITAINGQPATRFNDLREATRASGGQPVQLTLTRGGEEKTLPVTPRKPENESSYFTGLSFAPKDGISWDEYGPMTVDHPRPIEQVVGSAQSIVNTIGAIASPKSDVKVQHLGGPVMIFRAYYLLFESPQGWRLALWFSVILNVNLALLNLLPFPVLDGGHITLAALEAVRRKPLNVRLLEALQSACALLLISYMLYITFYDVGDLFGGRRAAPEMKFSPPEAVAAPAAAASPAASPTP